MLLRGTIIDLETTGLSPHHDKVISLGVLHDDVYTVIQSSGNDEAQFTSRLKSLMDSVPRPTFAFNKPFEESFLGVGVDFELQNRRFESKREAIRVEGVYDPFDGSGRAVPLEWEQFLIDHRRERLEKIIAHNIADLRYELCLAIMRK